MTATTQPAALDLNAIMAPDGYAAKVIRYRAAKLVERRVVSESEQDDVEQELSLRLLKRLPNYDPERAKLNTFIANAVQFEAKEIARLRRADKHMHRRRTLSLDAPVGEASDTPMTLGDLMTRSQQVRGRGRLDQDDQEEFELRSDLETVMAALPPDLKELCEKLMEARNPTAVRNSASPKALAELRRRFEEAGMEFYL